MKNVKNKRGKLLFSCFQLLRNKFNTLNTSILCLGSIVSFNNTSIHSFHVFNVKKLTLVVNLFQRIESDNNDSNNQDIRKAQQQ